jgi:NAD(P)-dependent dehydrogenase (short-subunit alcohol dehydrogenase family)
MDIAIVTGAGSGLGLAITRKLIELGLRVYGLGGQYDDARFDHEFFVPMPCNMGDMGDVRAKVAEILKREGDNVYVLVNNAKLYQHKSFEETSDEEMEAALKVNLLSPLVITRMTLPSLTRLGGFVINIVANTAENSRGGAMGAATAGGLRWMGEALFDQLRENGVKVSNVFPQTNKWRPDGSTPAQQRPQSAIDIDAVAEAVGSIVLNRFNNVVTDLVIRPQRLAEKPTPAPYNVPYPKPKPLPKTAPREEEERVSIAETRAEMRKESDLVKQLRVREEAFGEVSEGEDAEEPMPREERRGDRDRSEGRRARDDFGNESEDIDEEHPFREEPDDEESSGEENAESDRRDDDRQGGYNGNGDDSGIRRRHRRGRRGGRNRHGDRRDGQPIDSAAPRASDERSGESPERENRGEFRDGPRPSRDEREERPEEPRASRAEGGEVVPEAPKDDEGHPLSRAERDERFERETRPQLERRDNRPPREDRPQREERGERREDRPVREERRFDEGRREDRGERSDRSQQPREFRDRRFDDRGRDNRPPREDRPQREERGERREDRPVREERRFDEGRREDRGERSDRSQQPREFRDRRFDDRGRDNRPPREDRPQREERGERREDRPVREDRPAREERPVREEAPVREEMPREERREGGERPVKTPMRMENLPPRYQNIPIPQPYVPQGDVSRRNRRNRGSVPSAAPVSVVPGVKPGLLQAVPPARREPSPAPVHAKVEEKRTPAPAPAPAAKPAPAEAARNAAPAEEKPKKAKRVSHKAKTATEEAPAAESAPSGEEKPKKAKKPAAKRKPKAKKDEAASAE